MTAKLPNKRLRKIVKQAEKQGWRIRADTRHIQFIPPSGPIIIASRTPSDWRENLNFRACLKRAGFEQ